MRSKAIAALAALALATTLTVAGPNQTEEASAVACSDHASWACSGTIYYWPSAGQVKLTVNDHWVSAHWTTNQSNVTACTYTRVRSANTGRWYESPTVDCGGAPATVTINMGFPIDKVRITSKDNRGRWRYMTVEG